MSNERDFRVGLDLLNARVQKGVRTGMLQAALALHAASINEETKTPHDYGTLRASSSSVFVEGKLNPVAALPVEAGGKSPQPLTMLKSDNTPDVVRGTVTFNTPYAACIHEGMTGNGRPGELIEVENWGSSRARRGKLAADGGPYFLSEKQDKAHGVRYFRVIAAAVKKAKRG